MPGYDHNDLDQWLPTLLVDRGLSVERLAYKVGLTKGTIYKYLNDVIRPPAERMVKICEVLGVPAEEGLKQYSLREQDPATSPRSLRTRRRA